MSALARWTPPRLLLAGTVCGALFSALAGAQSLSQAELETALKTATDAFEAGNNLIGTDQAAAQAQYEKATLHLEQIIRDGGVENGKLYYNLGNIWYQRGNIGRAILNYRRAERYIPNNVELQQNLAFVMRQRKDTFQETERRKILSTLFFWHYDLSSGLRLRLFGLFFVAFWGIAALRLYGKHGMLTGLLAACGVLAALLFISLTVEARYHREHPRGVVVAAETVARKGDGETYQPSFSEPLHAGTEFTVRDDRGDWIQVTLPDDQSCWLPRGDVALVREKPGASVPRPGQG